MELTRVEMRGFDLELRVFFVFNRGVFGVEVRGFWCGTEGCVKMRRFWCGTEGFWRLKRIGPFVWN